jgi:hypothetical protein
MKKRLSRKMMIALGVGVLVPMMGLLLIFSRGTDTPAAAPPMSYAERGSWAYQPAEPPPGVWVNGWAVDVFLINPASGIEGGAPARVSAQRLRADTQAAQLAQGLADTGETYVPHYRALNRAEDIARAFETYVDTHNRGRALIIAVDGPVPAQTFARLKTDTGLRKRFGGFFSVTGNSHANRGAQIVFDDAEAPPLSDFCPPQLPDAATCIGVIKVNSANGIASVARDGGENAARIVDLRNFLGANVDQLAEPLGEIEDIDIVEIRAPGDTDEARAKTPD